MASSFSGTHELQEQGQQSGGTLRNIASPGLCRKGQRGESLAPLARTVFYRRMETP